MLYRKYRSKKFSELLGQDLVVKVLKQALKEEKVGHAYLFAGPRGTGKTSTARLLAKSLNCSNLIDGEPCNECHNCVAINQGNHMDLIEIDAASNRGIEEIRNLKENINFLPVEGKKKVYIIDEVHMLTNEAFNALLKTLEEPPQNVVFIFATTDVNKIPLTILSRTQRFDLKLANDNDLERKIAYILDSENIKYDKDALSIVAQAGAGSFRDTETLLEKIVSLIGSQKLTKAHVYEGLGYVNSDSLNLFIEALLSGKRNEALKLFDEILMSGVNLTNFIKQVLEILRQNILESINSNDDRLRKLMFLVKDFNDISQNIKSSLLPRLDIECLIVSHTGVSSTGTNTNSDMKQSTPNAPRKIEKIVAQDLPKTKVENIKTKDLPIKEVSSNIDYSTEYNIDEIKAKWGEVIQKSKVLNHHLAAFLGSSKLVDENGIKIKVPYPMHRDRISNADTRRSLEVIFKDIYGYVFRYDVELDPSLKDVEKKESGNTKLVEDFLN